MSKRIRRTVRLIGAVALPASQVLAAAAPVVPGWNRLKDGGASQAEQGQVLLGELNCTRCHAAPDARRILSRAAPDLSDVGSRLKPGYLREYLRHPHQVKPGAVMPDLFHASDPKARDGAVEFLVQYLVSLGGPIRAGARKDDANLAETGRRLYETVGCAACHAPATGDSGSVPSSPLPDPARQTTVDALQAFLLNPLTARPGGRMPSSGLSREEARAIAVWLVRGSAQATPATEPDERPFTVDPVKADLGGRMFAMLGCAACHELRDRRFLQSGRPLVDLDPAGDTGCLGGHIARGLPNYDLSSDQRKALAAAIQDRESLRAPFTPAGRALHTMAAMNCFACHSRDHFGGPPADRNDLFRATAGGGDEDRIPPSLTGVGWKLRSEAIDRIVFDGQLRVRPFPATRMPTWSRAALGDIAQTFGAADARASPPAPAFSRKAVEQGRLLVGVRGLGCIRCHSMNGRKSLGAPGSDLGAVHDRIRFGWFGRWLEDPTSLVPGTRMPRAVRDSARGIKEERIHAIWIYLSEGRAAPAAD